MTLLTTLALATSLIGATPADDKAPSGDLAKLQGEWTATVGPKGNITITMVVTKVKVAVKGTADGNDFAITGEVVLNDKASPKTIDWVKFTSPQGDEIKDNLGLYKLEGDSFTVCSGGPGKDRPTEFKAGEGGPPNIVAFTRKKADAKPEPKGDLAVLQGKWKAAVGPNKDRTIVITFKESKVEAKLTGENGDEMEFKGEFTINESASPKSIDFVKFKGSNGDEVGDNLGLYKVEGDSLTISVGGPGNARATEFKAGEGVDGAHLWTFTREKK